MKSIKTKVVEELIINKSTFINFLIPVQDIEEVNIELQNLKEKYSDANHHCFAYILGTNQEIQKYSDDGEPSKTAGLPMIEVLKKHDLTNVLNVSVRYFGGIKLGAGGLVRAYTKGCATSVSKATFTSLQLFHDFLVSVPFDMIGHVEKYIRDNYNLIETFYTDKVLYLVNISDTRTKVFTDTIQEKTNGIALIELKRSISKYV